MDDHKAFRAPPTVLVEGGPTPNVPMLLVSALLLALVAPLAHAHGGAEAHELETLVLVDEENGANAAPGGWDVVQGLIGEAHDPTLGQGADGDGVYWRAEFAGARASATPLSGGTWRAVFTFQGPGGPVVREIRDPGTGALETDFDALRANVSDGALHVERALVLLAGAGLSPGVTIEGFRIETYVGDRLHDKAPGGTPVAGPLEVPSRAEPGAERVTLTGPTRYAAATLAEASPDPVLQVRSLLKQGSQHVTVHLPPGVTTPDAVQVDLKPNSAVEVRLAFEENAGTHLPFVVTTDIGGRLTLALHREDGRVTLLDEAGTRLGGESPTDTNDVPWSGLVLAVAGLVLAARLRRPR